jgi:polar amino acid transport system substrate-binding protein
MSVSPTDPRIAGFMQAGKLRLAIFLPQYTKDAATGVLRGIGMGFVAMEMGRALAARLNVELQLVENPTPLAAAAALKSGACDLACLGIDPSRTAVLDFSPAVVQFDYTFLVPGNSAIGSFADADRPGQRIAVVLNHASTFALTRKAKHAELVGRELPDAAFDLLRAGQVEAFAAPREQLLDYSMLLPGSRVLDDSYGINNAGIALAQGQAGRLSYIREFVEQAKASGLIADIIQRGGLRGFRVAPPAGADTR